MPPARIQRAIETHCAIDWLSNNFTVYALLKPNTDAGPVATKMTKLVQDNFKAPAGTKFSFSLQPLKDLHLKSEHIVDGGRNSNVEAIAQGSVFYIKLFSFIALFVLLIAGINYMNLTTARASGRLKEIGVRKTIGAFKVDLIRQFLLESLLVTSISFVLSLILVNLLLPGFNQFTGKQLSLNFGTDYRIWLLAIGFAVDQRLFIGKLSGVDAFAFQTCFIIKRVEASKQNGPIIEKIPGDLPIYYFSSDDHRHGCSLSAGSLSE